MMSKPYDQVEIVRVRPIPYGSRARLGIILPSGNVSAEAELAAMLPEGVSLHVTRLRLTGSSPEQLLAMADNVEAAASLVADARPDLIGFHCTAVTTLSAELENSILSRAASAGGLPVAVTSQAVLAALNALDARQVVLVSPYLPHINESEVRFLSRNGVSVVGEFGLGIDLAADMYKVEPTQWLRIVCENAHPLADAYFVSCTAIRSAQIIGQIEEALGKPVVTSNQAMAWYLLRSVSVTDRMPGFGKLMSM